jgi:DNA-binding winged helix-turn-helix (wHTH) protein
MRFHFGGCALDLDTRQLTRGGRESHLSPKAFDLLELLVSERPKVLAKSVLQQRLWPGTFVAEANLSNLVGEIRKALGDKSRAPQFIRTAHGFGYAFCADATVDRSSDAPGQASPPVCWLEWGKRRFPLSTGENVLGRDPDVAVRLDESTISRRHARLLVASGGTELEDLDSKNGTFRGDDRVVSPIRLTDGDVIRIGSLVVIFRLRAPAESTETQRSTHPRSR